MAAQRRIAAGIAWLYGRAWGFYWRRCLTGLPWFWPAYPPGHPAMVEARRLVRRNFGRDHHLFRRKLAQVLVTMVWPAAVLINFWQMRHWLGPTDLAAARKRFPGALWAAIRHNILPSEYFGFGLWQAHCRAHIDSYLFSNEAARLFKVLNRPSQPDPISDKLAFHQMCKLYGIPNPLVLAAFASTGKLIDFESGRPPTHDLFVKVSVGRSLTERFRYERLRWQGSNFETAAGHHLKPGDLGGYLADLAKTENRTLIVQPFLSNHPDLHLEPDRALATARLVTGRSTDGEVTPIFCFILFGLPGKITAHSNWVTLIEIESGRFVVAPPPERPGVSMYRYRQFNSDGAHRLPDWDAAVKYVKMAHQACANFAFIGWDVAFTPKGPTILEGNANWDAATYQTLRGEPLGHTKFADILATHLTAPSH